jgi:protein farnesyltransferase subunit beta
VNYAKFGFEFMTRSNEIGPLFHNIALQQYILLCAQVGYGMVFSRIKNHSFLDMHACIFDMLNVIQNTTTTVSQVLEGGLRDKPGKSRDHYHSCYCLSGISVSQYSAMTDSDSCPLPQHVLGPYSNLLEPVHPLYNVVLDKYHTAYEFFWRVNK